MPGDVLTLQREGGHIPGEVGWDWEQPGCRYSWAAAGLRAARRRINL